jgi:hypothetical protein
MRWQGHVARNHTSPPPPRNAFKDRNKANFRVPLAFRSGRTSLETCAVPCTAWHVDCGFTDVYNALRMHIDRAWCMYRNWCGVHNNSWVQYPPVRPSPFVITVEHSYVHHYLIDWGTIPCHQLDVDGKITLEWILRKNGGRVCTGFIWLRIGTSGGVSWTR